MTHHEDRTARRGDRGFRRWFTPWRLIVGVLGLLVFLCLVTWRPIRVAYHQWQFERLMDRAWADEYPTMIDQLENRTAGYIWYRIYDHLKSLTEMGRLDRHDFRFKHVHNGTERARTLRMTRRWAPSAAWTEWTPASSKSPSPFEITVFCEPEDSDAWRRFVTNFDVPHEDDTIPRR